MPPLYCPKVVSTAPVRKAALTVVAAAPSRTHALVLFASDQAVGQNRDGVGHQRSRPGGGGVGGSEIRSVQFVVVAPNVERTPRGHGKPVRRQLQSVEHPNRSQAGARQRAAIHHINGLKIRFDPMREKRRLELVRLQAVSFPILISMGWTVLPSRASQKLFVVETNVANSLVGMGVSKLLKMSAGGADPGIRSDQHHVTLIVIPQPAEG